MPEVLILTGPPGAGKTAAAESLADRYDRVALIEVDTLRHFITPTGYIAPGKPGFERQHSLALRNACALTANFLEERIAVIIVDVLPEQEMLKDLLEGLKTAGSQVHLVRLLPRLGVCLERNDKRRDGRSPHEWVQREYERFVAEGASGGVTVDNSELSAYETADKLQALTTSGESLVWTPANA